MKTKFKVNQLVTHSSFVDYELIIDINKSNVTNIDLFYEFNNEGGTYKHACFFVDRSDSLITDIFII